MIIENSFSWLLRWLSRRSLATLHAFGGIVGWLTYALAPGYRRRFIANATLAGIGRAAVRPAIAATGRMLLELPYLWLRPADRPISPLVQWRGADVMATALARARSSGRGLVCLSPHLGAFEATAQAYAERYGDAHPMTVLYRPARKPWLRDLVDSARCRPGLSSAPASLAGVRQMMRALRRGETVGLLPDQVPPDGMGVWAPFFGRPAYTMTLAARLALQTGAEIVLLRSEHLPRGRGFVIEATWPREPLPAASPGAEAAHPLACACAINREMERMIRANPGQYLWAYDRYRAPRGGA